MRFSQGYKPSGVARQQQPDISIAPSPTTSAARDAGYRINRSNSSAVREALVTEFLRDALAADAVPVPELDAKAQAAGLLGEGQRITHAKVFKRTKKFLGIKSVRNGFGVGVNGSGGWKGGLLRPSLSPCLSRTPMRKLLVQKEHRPMCEHVAFLPLGSTGSRASTTIAHTPTSHRTDGASF
jgi:hypothetical protein